MTLSGMLITTSAVILSFIVLAGTVPFESHRPLGRTADPLTDAEAELQTINGTNIPYSLYLKAASYLRKSALFNNYTDKELFAYCYELETWEAPELMRKSLPYYLAGSDFEGRPVLVSEFGKYDVVGVVKKVPNAIQLMEKYAFQYVWRVVKSLHARDTLDNEFRTAFLILDCEGLDISFLTYTEVLQFALRMVRDTRGIIAEITAGVVAINVNYVAQAFFSLVKPVVGGLFERVDIHGNARSAWIPKLRQLFPDESLPPWYGGKEDFKPECVY